MLKLTNSFCRFFTVTCENFNYKAYVSVGPYIGGARRCGGECAHTRRQFHASHARHKKRTRIKIPPLNDIEFDRTLQMSDPSQPTHKHASYGGHFTVSSSDEENTGDEFSKKSRTSSESEQPPCEIPPDFRVWEKVCSTSNGSVKFKVVSYNVLAQYLLECHPYLYTECAPNDLKWDTRAARLFHEILQLAPDILCLQEVQVSHLKSFYSKFEEIGYQGVFKQKTGQRQDGCAIYYKRSLFQLQDHISVELYQRELPILNRDNVGVMVRLGLRGAPALGLVVATTHLLYNPKRTDVRLAQMQLFLAEIDRFAYYCDENGSGHLPIILTGDLNSTPDSAVIQLLDRGHVSASCYRDNSDWQRIGVTDNCQHLSVYLDRQDGKRTHFNDIMIENSDYGAVGGAGGVAGGAEWALLFNGDEVAHSLHLASVYDRRKPDGSPEASTYQDYWLTVDYIYFSRYSRLRVCERLRLPTAAECEASLGRLPNRRYGSDHLALAALFELTPPAHTAHTTHNARAAL